MSTRAKVAVLFTTPEQVLPDYERLMHLADVKQHLDPSATTILKDNISWHFPFPSANTTPWQLEGSIVALRNAGFDDLVCVQNKTVVTDAFKGEDLNKYVPVFRQHEIPVQVQLPRGGHGLGGLPPEAPDARARQDLPGRHQDPGLLPRQEHRPPADGEVPHLHDDDRAR